MMGRNRVEVIGIHLGTGTAFDSHNAIPDTKAESNLELFSRRGQVLLKVIDKRTARGLILRVRLQHGFQEQRSVVHRIASRVDPRGCGSPRWVVVSA
jgi:hypothetical protein